MKRVFGPGLLLTSIMMGTGLLSRVWTPEPPTRLRIALRLRPPFGQGGWLGSDALGHDIASGLMAGIWTSLSIALPAVILGLGAGTILGLIGAWRKGFWGEAAMRLTDLLFSFPAPITAVMIGALIGPGQSTATIAIALFAVPVFARLAYAETRRLLAMPFCLAAEAMGLQPARIIGRHVLPNMAGTLAVQFCLQVGLAILIETGLSFLGMSARPPTPSLGRMLAESQTYLMEAPWLALGPGVTIALIVLGLNLLGDELRDWFDPRRPSA